MTSKELRNALPFPVVKCDIKLLYWKHFNKQKSPQFSPVIQLQYPGEKKDNYEWLQGDSFEIFVNNTFRVSLIHLVQSLELLTERCRKKEISCWNTPWSSAPSPQPSPWLPPSLPPSLPSPTTTTLQTSTTITTAITATITFNVMYTSSTTTTISRPLWTHTRIIHKCTHAWSRGNLTGYVTHSMMQSQVLSTYSERN